MVVHSGRGNTSFRAQQLASRTRCRRRPLLSTRQAPTSVSGGQLVTKQTAWHFITGPRSSQISRRKVSSTRCLDTYRGNPTGAFAGQNTSVKYAFFNVYSQDGASWDKIIFTNNGSSGFESDNHTTRDEHLGDGLAGDWRIRLHHPPQQNPQRERCELISRSGNHFQWEVWPRAGLPIFVFCRPRNGRRAGTPLSTYSLSRTRRSPPSTASPTLASNSSTTPSTGA